MSDEELCWMAGHEMAAAVLARRVSPTELVTAALRQLEKVEPAVNAFVTVTAERALDDARAAERALLAGEPIGPLHGVPLTLKDLTSTAGVRTTFGTTAYADHVPDQDDIAWARLKRAGAILIGKTTTPEFGLLGVTESALTGRTSTPWAAPTHTSGGSSGGAAASVAAGVVPFAWGSDGGGSIRVPAACCGVVGLKASPHRIPAAELWDTTAVEGPLTRHVRDAALLLDVTAGAHPSRPLSPPRARTGYEAATVRASLRGLRIAFSPDFGSGPIDDEVLAVVEAAVRTMEELGGAHVDAVDIRVPDPIEYFPVIYGPETHALLQETGPAGRLIDHVRHPAIRRMADLGSRVTLVEHLRARGETRTQILAGFLAALAHHDLIVAPTMPVTAFPHPGDAGGNTHVNGVPVREPALDFHRLTESPTHAGLPAVSVNCGFSAAGLPVGLQIIGPPWGDREVLAAAAAFEDLTGWAAHRPPLATA